MKVSESLQNDETTANETALHRAVDTTPAFIHTARPDGYLDYFNRGWLNFLGKSLEDVRGWRWTESVHPEDVATLVQKWHAALASGEPLEVESRVRRADGTYRAFLHRKVPLRDEHGNIAKWFGSSIDIEDRKCAEQRMAEKASELERSEFYLREGERLAHMGSWSLKPDGIFDYWSPETFVIFGFDPSESIPTLPKWLTALHPDDRDLVAKTIERIFREGVRIDVTYRVDHPKQRKRIMHSTGEPVVGDGKVTRLIGNTLDITEQENAAQDLQRSEFYLREGERLAHMGSWSLRPDGTFDYWSPETFVLFGFDPSEGIPALPKWLTVLHPDDRDRVAKTLERIFRENVRIDVTYRVDHPKQGKRIMHSTGEPVVEDGKVTRLIGNTLDITEQENAIRELTKAFGEIRALKDELYKENIVLRHEIGSTSMFEEVLGTSSALQNVLALAAKVAPTDSSVLIAGETGTGKELIARAIHKRSKRCERSFVGVNCATIPSSLIMSELFGHEKGAFTGAVQRRLGRFELAEGGTLFLDEVGDLPLETQIALLRVLQEREFERVGGTEMLRCDVRMIAATNRDLHSAIAAGSFRSDLFYRLNVFPIELPPLRERKEDIPILVNYFVNRYAQRAGKKIDTIRKKSIEALQEYSWPGNVRELQNVIERSLIIVDTNEFSVDKNWLSHEFQSSRREGRASRISTEQEQIEAALAQSNGKVSGAHGAAAKLGIPASTLESKIRSLRINKFQFKGV
jgi:PAS domain S-box-containing protein